MVAAFDPCHRHLPSPHRHGSSRLLRRCQRRGPVLYACTRLSSPAVLVPVNWGDCQQPRKQIGCLDCSGTVQTRSKVEATKTRRIPGITSPQPVHCEQYSTRWLISFVQCAVNQWNARPKFCRGHACRIYLIERLAIIFRDRTAPEPSSSSRPTDSTRAEPKIQWKKDQSEEREREGDEGKGSDEGHGAQKCRVGPGGLGRKAKAQKAERREERRLARSRDRGTARDCYGLLRNELQSVLACHFHLPIPFLPLLPFHHLYRLLVSATFLPSTTTKTTRVGQSSSYAPISRLPADATGQAASPSRSQRRHHHQRSATSRRGSGGERGTRGS